MLAEERFGGEILPKGWTVKSGQLRVGEGVLRASRATQTARLCLFNLELPIRDAAIQIDFRFEGASGINVSLNPFPGELNKHGHLFSVMITQRTWNITEHNDANSRSKALPSAPGRFEAGKWYTLLLETRGDEVGATVAGKKPLRASSRDFHVKKPGIEFRVAGRDDQAVGFDNLLVWELGPPAPRRRPPLPRRCKPKLSPTSPRQKAQSGTRN